MTILLRAMCVLVLPPTLSACIDVARSPTLTSDVVGPGLQSDLVGADGRQDIVVAVVGADVVDVMDTSGVGDADVVEVLDSVGDADADTAEVTDTRVVSDSDAADSEVMQRVEDRDAGCSDGQACVQPDDPCFVSVCTEGRCVETFAQAGTSCRAAGSPSDACEGTVYHNPDVCDGLGACVDGGASACRSQGVCHVATCTPGQGCRTDALAPGTACGNGTPSDSCEGAVWHLPDRCDAAGNCLEGGTMQCDTGEPCVVGQCAEGGCVAAMAQAGTPCRAGSASGECQGLTWHPVDRCDGLGGCVDVGPEQCQAAGECQLAVCSAEVGCDVEPVAAGSPCDADGLSAACVGDAWHGPDTCDGAGECSDGAVTPCPEPPCLQHCWGGVDPKLVGCSDGHREGFVDLDAYPDIASCGGAWTVPGVFHDHPACGRRAGDDASNPEGVGCNALDLCAEGWEICADLAQLADYTGTAGCRDAVAGDYPNRGTGPLGEDPAGVPILLPPGGAFFVAAVTGAGSGQCDAQPEAHNDLFGCGNMGRVAKPGCLPLNRTSDNACRGLQNYHWSSGADRDNPATDYGYSDPSQWSWWCPGEGDSSGEPDTVIKEDPDQQGGVLCCRIP